jgi:hypothetical protein
MVIMNFTSAGFIAGVLSVLGAVSIAVGKPALSTFFSDPGTATAATGVVTGIVGLVAGALKGVKG